jgi:hypothetical protein
METNMFSAVRTRDCLLIGRKRKVIWVANQNQGASGEPALSIGHNHHEQRSLQSPEVWRQMAAATEALANVDKGLPAGAIAHWVAGISPSGPSNQSDTSADCGGSGTGVMSEAANGRQTHEAEETKPAATLGSGSDSDSWLDRTQYPPMILRVVSTGSSSISDIDEDIAKMRLAGPGSQHPMEAPAERASTPPDTGGPAWESHGFMPLASEQDHYPQEPITPRDQACVCIAVSLLPLHWPLLD